MKSTTKLQFSILSISVVIAVALFALFALAPSIIWTSNLDWSTGAFTNVTNMTGNLMLNNTIVNGTAAIYSWLYSNWTYRKAIIINGSTSLQNDYQVMINLTNRTAGTDNFNFARALSDGNDTRFTWLNASSGLEQNVSFWIENWTSSSGKGNATLWVKVPNVTASSVANTTLYMYYGNPSATYNNSLGGNNTFVVFDDFENYPTGNLNGSNGWTGSIDYQVDTANKYQGSKSVKNNVSAAVNIDNTGTSIYQSWNTALNLSGFSVGSGANRLLLVGLSYTLDPGTTTAKYNNTNLTRAMRANNGNYYVELWYLVNPPSGSYTIETTRSGVTTAVLGAWSYTGVDQVTPIGNITNRTGTSTISNVNITTTVANSVLVDVEANQAASSLTVGAGQTQRYKSSNLDAGGSEMNASAIGTYNMNWTLGSVSTWAIIAAEIKPAAITIEKSMSSLTKGVITFWLDPVTAYADVGGGIIGTTETFFVVPDNNVFVYRNITGGWTSTGISYTAGNWYKVEIVFDTDTDKYVSIKINGQSGGTNINSQSETSASKVRIGRYSSSADTGNIDNIFVRKYASPEPNTLSVGAERTASSKGTYLSNTTTTSGAIASITPIINKTEYNYNGARNLTNLTVDISANGGSSWCGNVANGTAYTSCGGIGSGTQLKYRINFSTNDTSRTAILSDITIIVNIAPQWSANATSPNSPQTYNLNNNYSFQINWSSSDNIFANATFQHGMPNGVMMNHTDNTTGLVGYWRLNAVNGTNYTKDFSGYGNDGRLMKFDNGGNPPVNNFTAGKIGNALKFDGVNDYINVPTSSSLNPPNNFTEFTMSGWIYMKGMQPFFQHPWGPGHYYTFYISPNSSTLAFKFTNIGGVQETRAFQDISQNQWIHLAATYDGSNIRAYVNGTLKYTEPASGTLYVPSNQPFIIGATASNNNFWNGTIDEVRIYNRSLSADEIATQYQMQYPYYAGTDDSLNGAWAINFTQPAIGGAGTYNYTWFGIDTVGLQNSTQTVGYMINKVPTLTRLFLNVTEGNKNYNISQTANFTVTLNISGKTVYLDTNLSGWSTASGTAPLYNYTQMQGAGIYNITGYFVGDENYSASSATYFASIIACSSNSVSCVTQAYPFSGWVFDAGAGSIAGAGTLTISVKETGERFVSSFSGGYFSVSPQFCLSPGTVYNFALNAESGGKAAHINFKRTAKANSLLSSSCTSSQPSCSFQAYPISGWALDSKTGLPVQNGTAQLAVKDTGDSYAENFTGGYFSVSPQFCLSPEAVYSFALSIEGNEKQGFMTYRKAGKI